jgi:hypothetical protein
MKTINTIQNSEGVYTMKRGYNVLFGSIFVMMERVVRYLGDLRAALNWKTVLAASTGVLVHLAITYAGVFAGFLLAAWLLAPSLFGVVFITGSAMAMVYFWAFAITAFMGLIDFLGLYTLRDLFKAEKSSDAKPEGA